jgi:UTP--glucose-1-phosphate uridylyltransferase
MTMKIRKAVITAAGWGTRFLPATKVQPKEMLPVLNKPVIQYVVEEAISSGIQQIIIVTARGKNSVEEHFDRFLELENLLREKGMLDVLESLYFVDGTDISYVHQRQQLGLGHATYITHNFIGEEPFALLLPDDIIDHEVPGIKQLIDIYEDLQSSILAVEDVPEEKLQDYGIINPDSINENLYQVHGMVEKPEASLAPSRLGIVGRYILTPGIFSAIEKTLPGKNGEIQLTDALNILLKSERIYGYRFKGTRYDCGTPMGLLKTSIAFAMKDPVKARELTDFVNSIKTIVSI